MSFSKITISAFALAGGMLVTAAPSWADTVLYVDADASGSTHDGSSWCDAYLTLYEALSEVTPPATIRVANGIYTPDPSGLIDPREATFQLINGVTIEGGYAGCNDGEDARDLVLYETTLSGDLAADDTSGSGSNCCGMHGTPGCDNTACEDAVCDFIPECCSGEWDAVCLQRAFSAEECQDICDDKENAYHVVTGSDTDNSAVLDGFTVIGGNANVQVWSDHHFGGGLYNSVGSPTVRTCVLRGNKAYGGGAIGNHWLSSPVIAGCTFADNYGSDGGAIWNDVDSSPHISGSRFIGNVSGIGGAIINTTRCSPVIVNCAFVGNTAAQGIIARGGAIVGFENSNVTVSNSSFYGNSAWTAGTVALEATGGALYNHTSNPTLTNCVFWGNTDDGGSDESAQIHIVSGTVVVNYSCVQGLSGGLGGTGNTGSDPLFIDPDGDDNITGTEDDDLRLSGASSCIDAGDNEADTNHDVAGTQPLPLTDLDNGPRFVDDFGIVDSGNGVAPIVDMGAYEHHEDCNDNGIDDVCDISCDPPECDPPCATTADCNENGVPDECEADCNGNDVPDECDIADETSYDCDEDGIPDDCQEDCNGNGRRDVCDIEDLTSEDCTDNGIPDECEPDCQPNGTADSCDIDNGTSPDCNANGIPDDCDITAGTSPDTNPNNGIPDECEATVLYVGTGSRGLNNGTSWADAYTDLQDALATAEGSGGATQEIWVAAGTYIPDRGTGDRLATFQLLDSVAIYGGFAGTETSFSERDVVANVTILSGDLDGNDGPDPSGISENSYHIITATDAEATAILNGFTIQGGNANASSFPHNSGGGVLIRTIGELSKPTIADCRFESNAASRGGAIMHNGGDSLISNCTFEDNSATLFGGAICFEGGDPVVSDCNFQFNSAGRFGGAISASGSTSSPVITRSAFVNNLSMESGGAAYIQLDSEPVFAGCRLEENEAMSQGGGIANRVGHPQLINTVVSRNVAEWGGGIHGYSDSNPTLVNSSVCFNLATQSIFGGGLQSDGGVPTIVNSIVWGNIDGSGVSAGSQIKGAPVVRYSVVQGGWTGDGDNNIDVDPRITPDGHLRADSPLIDAGDPSFVPDAHGLIEIDGEDRITGGRVDIGPEEFKDTDSDGLPDWWEDAFAAPPGRAVKAAANLDPSSDPDGDGLTNLEEYELFSSSPVASPIYVDAVSGDDENDGLTPGTAKMTIQAGLDLAQPSDTVLVAPGTYTGAENRELDFAGKPVVLRGTSGAASTILDLQNAGRGFDFRSQETAGAAVTGFTIQNGSADQGGAVRIVNNARPQIRDSVFIDNTATNEGGTIYVQLSAVALADVEIQAPVDDNAAVIELSLVQLDGVNGLSLSEGEFTMKGSWAIGSGGIDLAEGTLLRLTKSSQYGPPNVLRSDLCCDGEAFVEHGATTRVEGGAVLELGGVETAALTVEGEVLVRDAIVQNTDADLKLVELEGHTDFVASDLELMESSEGFGGEFNVHPNSTVEGNVITSFNDRYFDLDPDPEAASRPTLVNNTIRVFAPPTPSARCDGAARGVTPPPKGHMSELRTTDADCSGECGSAAVNLADSPGYSDTWALDELTVETGAILNLTNRTGFDFRAVGETASEVMYVKDLVLQLGSMLNLGGQRLYYQTLTGNLDQIVDVPLHGFSLRPIHMEEDLEFDVRVRRRLAEDPDDPNSPVGSIVRADVSIGGAPPVGVLDMETFTAATVAAKAAFARSAEDDLLVGFRYRFVSNPDAELVISLSGNRDIGEDNFEVARIRPPTSGRPGSIGSDEFALYLHRVQPGGLNLTHNTYVELELTGANSQIQIDDWDPQVLCAYQGVDLSGDHVLSNADYLYALRSYGSEQDLDSVPHWCVDNHLSRDHYIDLADLLTWDTLVNEETSLSANSIFQGHRDIKDVRLRGARTRDLDHLTMSIRPMLGGNQKQSGTVPKGTVATRSASFQWDDGSAEDSMGVNDGVDGLTFGWANQFQNTTGECIVLQSIEVAFGVPGGAVGVSPGDAVDAVIWLDTAATGNMANASKVAQWALPGGVHANDGTFVSHTIPSGGVAIPSTAEFYIGLGDIQTQNDQAVRYPAAIDQTAGEGKSWAFYGSTTFDPDDLAGQTIDLIDNMGFPGNWLIRGQAATGVRQLLIGGKEAAQQDYLYALDVSAVSVDAGGVTQISQTACVEAPQTPPSQPGLNGFRANGRLAGDDTGAAYQIHGRQGVIRVADSEPVIPPGTLSFAGASVQVGLTAVVAGDSGDLPLLDIAPSPTDDEVLYVVPVVVTPSGGQPYRAAAKLRLLEGPEPYAIEELYGLDPVVDLQITADPPEISEIDVQRLREIEIDAYGNLYVLAANSANLNDWLLIYDEASGTGSEQRVLLTDLFPSLKDPGALTVSADGNTLYLASSINSPGAVSTQVFSLSVSQTERGVQDITPGDVIEIQDMGHVTSIAEDVETGRLFVVGFMASDLGEFAIFEEADAIYTIPSLALVPPATPTVRAALVDCHNLVLPLSVILRGVGGCGGCFESSQAAAEVLDLEFDPVSRKIRYLSFSAGNAGRTQAVRVTFDSVPSPYDHWNGTQLWVQQPQVYCENAGVAQADPCPEGAGGLPSTDFWGAGLGCDPYVTDWTQYDMVHVFNEGIIPGGTYDTQVIDSMCSLYVESNYSDALTLTQSAWADLVQDCSTTPCKPPDGSTGIVDVTAILDKWKNLPGNVKKVRADIEGSPAGDHRVPDQAINITDVTYCLGAFLGDTYPGPGFPAPSDPPDCP